MTDAECEEAVSCALQEGYRLIDTAQLFRNEAGVGRATDSCTYSAICIRFRSIDGRFLARLECTDGTRRQTRKTRQNALCLDDLMCESG